MRRTRIAVLLLLMVLALVVVLQNTGDVSARLLWVTVSMPLAAMLFLTLLLGAALGLLLALLVSGRSGEGHEEGGDGDGE